MTKDKVELLRSSIVVLCTIACTDVTPARVEESPANDPDDAPQQVCSPGTAICEEDFSKVCREDGLGYETHYCDPVQDMECDDTTGLCSGVCAPQSLGKSYVGCEYYPTVTGNRLVENTFSFAVAVANTSEAVAHGEIEGGSLPEGDKIKFQVQPGAVEVRVLPWVYELKDAEGPVALKGGAYHLRTDQPVTVYQFNALEYETYAYGLAYSYSNDASLLLPTNAMSGNYVAAAYPWWIARSIHGFVSITATEDDTQLDVVTTAPVNEGGGLPAFVPRETRTIYLSKGDVAQIMNGFGDLTGTSISASAPVQVIGGHVCSNVPSTVPACDHLEESMLPTETLGSQYLVTAPAVPSLPQGKQRVVRIIALGDDTTLTYDPPQPDLASTIAKAGDFIELEGTADSFLISASDKVAVSEYMTGQAAGGDAGDPAMTVAPPIDQFRDLYKFHAPQNYQANYVNVVAPVGATIKLDGQTLFDFEVIGDTGFSVKRVSLPDKPSGNYTLIGDRAFGISVYGYGQYTSYWYPGGLDLNPIGVD